MSTNLQSYANSKPFLKERQFLGDASSQTQSVKELQTTEAIIGVTGTLAKIAIPATVTAIMGSAEAAASVIPVVGWIAAAVILVAEAITELVIFDQQTRAQQRHDTYVNASQLVIDLWNKGKLSIGDINAAVLAPITGQTIGAQGAVEIGEAILSFGLSIVAKRNASESEQEDQKDYNDGVNAALSAIHTFLSTAAPDKLPLDPADPFYKHLNNKSEICFWKTDFTQRPLVNSQFTYDDLHVLINDFYKDPIYQFIGFELDCYSLLTVNKTMWIPPPPEDAFVMTQKADLSNARAPKYAQYAKATLSNIVVGTQLFYQIVQKGVIEYAQLSYKKSVVTLEKAPFDYVTCFRNLFLCNALEGAYTNYNMKNAFGMSLDPTTMDHYIKAYPYQAITLLNAMQSNEASITPHELSDLSSVGVHTTAKDIISEEGNFIVPDIVNTLAADHIAIPASAQEFEDYASSIGISVPVLPGKSGSSSGSSSGSTSNTPLLIAALSIGAYLLMHK